MHTVTGNLILQLPPTRRKILIALKKSGGMTTGELSEILGLTSMGVRRHLTTLERDGLVTFDSRQQGVGRPAYVYRLTPQGENLFPKNYHALTNELLSYLDEAEIERIFQRRAEQRLRRGRARLAGLDWHDKMAELARMLDEDGYLVEWERVDGDTYRLSEFNCVIQEVAYRYRQACATELAFLRELLPEAEVEREAHIMSGASSCTYRIRRKA